MVINHYHCLLILFLSNYQRALAIPLAVLISFRMVLISPVEWKRTNQHKMGYSFCTYLPEWLSFLRWLIQPWNKPHIQNNNPIQINEKLTPLTLSNASPNKNIARINCRVGSMYWDSPTIVKVVRLIAAAKNNSGSKVTGAVKA